MPFLHSAELRSQNCRISFPIEFRALLTNTEFVLTSDTCGIDPGEFAIFQHLQPDGAGVFHHRHHGGVAHPTYISANWGHTVHLDAQTPFGWPPRRARNGNLREKTSFRRASIHAFFQTELGKKRSLLRRGHSLKYLRNLLPFQSARRVFLFHSCELLKWLEPVMIMLLTFVQNISLKERLLWMLHFFENGSLSLLERFFWSTS
jgi:hypothetical protein